MCFKLVVIVICCSLFSMHRAEAQNERMLQDIQRMTVRSNLIVCGVAGDVSSRWNRDTTRIYSYTVIYVNRVLKGVLTNQRLVVQTFGGEVGNVGVVVPGEASFRKGESVLLFLRSENSDNYNARVMFGDMGKLKVYNGNDNASYVVRNSGTEEVELASLEAVCIAVNSVEYSTNK